MRRIALVFTLTASSVAAAQPATVEPAPPTTAPAASPTFVTLERFDATSIGGLSVTYLEPNSKTFSGGDLKLFRFAANAQYVDAPTGFGGYVQAPLAMVREKTGSTSNTTTSFGDIEVGGIFVPHLSTPDIGVVLHAGVTAPTGEDGSGEALAGLLESGSMLREVYDAIPKGVTARVGVSPTLRRGNLFARADVGLDWNISASKNVSVGNGIHYDLGVGVDLGTAAVMIESANLTLQSDSPAGSTKNATTLNTLAISARAIAGSALPYVGVIIPLEEDTSDIYDVAIIAGVDFKL